MTLTWIYKGIEDKVSTGSVLIDSHSSGGKRSRWKGQLEVNEVHKKQTIIVSIQDIG